MKRITPTFIIAVLIFMATRSIGQTWSTVGSANSLHSTVTAMFEYNSILYVGGSFSVSSAAPGNGIAQWNGTAWDSVGSGVNLYVYTICEYNGEIYAGGLFSIAGGNPARNIAKWNGTAWLPLGSGINYHVYCLSVYNGELYAGGAFDSAGGVFAPHIAKWNGSNWSAVGNGFTSGGYGPQDMVVWNGELYVNGVSSINGNPALGLAKWDGVNWTAVGAGYGHEPLCVYNGELYVARQTSVSGAFIAKWDGITWTDVGNVTNPYNTSMVEVRSMAVYNSELYVGGKFFRVAGNLIAPQICKWDGSNWSVFDGVHEIDNDSATWSGPYILSMCTYNSDLYVGGNFTRAGSTSFNAYDIARLTSSPTEVEKEIASNKINIFPNPATSELRIENSELRIKEIEINNLLGEKVFSQLQTSNLKLQTVDVSQLLPGIYFITITDEAGNKVTGKVVKM